jgi:hypothetical protein
MELAGGGLLRPVRHAVDHQTAHATDAFTAVTVERNGILTTQSQPLVEHIQHLQERHVF